MIDFRLIGGLRHTFMFDCNEENMNFRRLGESRKSLLLVVLIFLGLSAATWRFSEYRVAVEFASYEYSHLASCPPNEPARTNSVFCLILTKPEYIETRALSVYRTWARHCDEHRFITLVPTNQSLELLDLSLNVQGYQLSILKPSGFTAETYEQLTDKVFRALTDLHRMHSNTSFDWYLKADDDTFVFMDNLRKFVAQSDQPCAARVYGFELESTFYKWLSGGAGYLMSKEAFSRLGDKLNEDYNFCSNSGTEDLDVVGCLRKLGVVVERSVDNEERERFHP